MDLDFLTMEQLLRFLHCKKTEISCIEQPLTLLNQLRDHNLVPEDRYQKVIRMRSKQRREKGLYDVLDWLETKRPDSIKLFWSCMLEDHIQQSYPVIRQLRNKLLDGSFQFFEDLPEKKETSEESKEEEKKKKTEGKKSAKKRRKKSTESVEEDEEEPGPSTQSTPSKKKKMQKPSYSSPIKKGEKEDIWTWPFYKTQLPVKCGDKEGSLNRDKLSEGKECILAEGRWFTPSAFEEFGGKKHYKNWKKSICCQKTPLQKLIEEGHLKTPRFWSRRSLTSLSEQRRTTSLHTRQSELSFSDSVSDFEEEEEEETKVEENEDEDQEKNRDRGAAGNGDDSGTSEFPGARLSVTCGSATGTLQKDRFASGTSGKCIRMASKWLTPVEFARVEPTMADSYWKKSILCQGVPLSDLIERKILRPHSLNCPCKLCSKNERDLEEQENDDHCFVCGAQGSLLCCDQCPRAFHYKCHLPTVDESMLGEQWLCTYCVLTQSQGWRLACDRTLAEALGSRISDSMLQCQYLLLQLYSSDEGHVFFSDPCATVTDYRKIIRNPMWLDKVAEKLQKRQYSSVSQFVSDIQLIFTNCTTFNRLSSSVKGHVLSSDPCATDIDFGQLGARLNQLFETEFKDVFNVKNI